MKNNLEKYTLLNLDCANCAMKIEQGIKTLDCVKSASVDFATLSLLIETSDINKVQETISAIEPEVILTSANKPHQKPEEHSHYSFRKEALFLSVSAVLMFTGIIAEYTSFTLPTSWLKELIFITVYLLSGWNVVITALKDIRHNNYLNENFLMTLATAAAFAIGAPAEAAGVMFFYKIGEILQELSVNRSRRSIRSLLEIRPDYANLNVNGDVRKVSPHYVSIGDTFIVKAGEKIPLDGIVITGSSLVDTSLLTGESVPREVSIDSPVIAGSINRHGLLEVRATKRFEESSINKILDLVENASHKKAKTEKFITVFARYYTPVIVGISALIAFLPPLIIGGALFSDWIYRGLVILVISCPCALVISIPLGYFGGIGGASRRGILIKGSEYIDALAKVKTVVFDKTGTLTKGVFAVQNIVPHNGISANELLELAAEAESHSNHPIAVSIRTAYGKPITDSAITSYREMGGHGVEAIINGRAVLIGNDRMLYLNSIDHPRCDIDGTVIHAAVDGRYAGYIVIGDEIKHDAYEAIRSLRKHGITRTAMLTGDNECAAAAVSNSLSIDEFHANLLPEDKLAHLEQIISEAGKNHAVAFAGDGVNDAPVMARADVSIAMGSLGSDAAIENADIVIMNDSPAKVAEAITIAHRTRSIVMQNIIFAISVKLIFVALGSVGVAGMWEAVFADIGVALIAIVNAMRAVK